MTHIVLKLYVTGQSPRSEQAIADLKRLCERELTGRYELSIVDVLAQPQVAEAENVLATPTLVKELPPPNRRVVGDLSDLARVLAALGLEGGSR
ncbi:circadian clock KaiB family protein [Candidatus Binatia bacterium]|nr:circadian clock KaiB family protein [Candidatus Binatia bacterium]